LHGVSQAMSVDNLAPGSWLFGSLHLAVRSWLLDLVLALRTACLPSSTNARFRGAPQAAKVEKSTPGLNCVSLYFPGLTGRGGTVV